MLVLAAACYDCTCFALEKYSALDLPKLRMHLYSQGFHVY